MLTTNDDVVLEALKQLQSYFENKPIQRNTWSGRQVGRKDEDVLQTVLPRLKDWAERIQTLHSSISVGPNRQTITSESDQEGEDSGRSLALKATYAPCHH
ncbi:hypothetical protein FOXG_17046 [Fusarium oxysporum f. sp. lycopersici 4287]|uniref:Uncharacterized protein n=2 Tax=Fusarium oxysporum TaxID=5507 RepID=A0A0J9VTN8_FUSO4|nr:hypothetical protein FOXG_12579 [Fusarium oxysporum f. sp. lycopersici 4287]XP_018252166.1 hypothetical protein FOXG_12630 [Fusarium oxysporum f. sp. lycopersici 4287]XP_018253437.1 hypothetical protein FOXG_13961 [Fusarium oxysporum f. sp. lycopersici 4287]XP_018257901.1 hypothetical protein FOXG_17046 [Fusarium oxysporum f. sp. lycopersici 4287]KNB14005.1 hypothetical protein FOXG_12579 [Fusarium oxysporum f. sp. lycopersici 4287]KNB14121.1 hypothetical protein FOXG_12630 [Fusarium oxyspo